MGWPLARRRWERRPNPAPVFFLGNLWPHKHLSDLVLASLSPRPHSIGRTQKDLARYRVRLGRRGQSLGGPDLRRRRRQKRKQPPFTHCFQPGADQHAGELLQTAQIPGRCREAQIGQQDAALRSSGKRVIRLALLGKGEASPFLQWPILANNKLFLSFLSSQKTSKYLLSVYSESGGGGESIFLQSYYHHSGDYFSGRGGSGKGFEQEEGKGHKSLSKN